MLLEIALFIIGIILGALLLLTVVRRIPGHQTEDPATRQMFQSLAERIDHITSTVDSRLRDNAHAINESKSFLADRVSSSEKTAREVSNKLGELGQATAALHKTSAEISSFQKMLRSPKIRGSFGEVLLSNLLGEVLPSDRFTEQYNFRRSGDVADAIIRLQDGYIVAIDAKFPLANYEAYINQADDAVRITARKEFLRDIKKHIRDISAKYISPAENTLEYAFMYIPIEGIYYETMVHDQAGETLWQFCLDHKVIPVSPNSFLAYLQTVLVGLRGMKIQEQAKEILASLGQIRRDFGLFAKDYTMIGTHLTNAKNRYDDSSRRLDKFANRLDQIETTVENPRLEENSSDRQAG